MLSLEFALKLSWRLHSPWRLNVTNQQTATTTRSTTHSEYLLWIRTHRCRHVLVLIMTACWCVASNLFRCESNSLGKSGCLNFCPMHRSLEVLIARISWISSVVIELNTVVLVSLLSCSLFVMHSNVLHIFHSLPTYYKVSIGLGSCCSSQLKVQPALRNPKFSKLRLEDYSS